MALAEPLLLVEPAASPAPTRHVLRLGDARAMDWLADESIHLAVTSPPYWTLKKYNDHPDQLGDLSDYEDFIAQLDRVWHTCSEPSCQAAGLSLLSGTSVCLAARTTAATR